jgi:hypothetical protein
MIGGGREADGLYYLDSGGSPSIACHSTFLSDVNKDRVMLWHTRLGHLPLVKSENELFRI